MQGHGKTLLKNKKVKFKKKKHRTEAKPTGDNTDVLTFIPLNKQVDGILKRLRIKQQRRYILKQDPCPHFPNTKYKQFQLNHAFQV